MEKRINFTLPEFCFLDGNSHEGDTLEDRTIIQHIRSYTIIESFSYDDFKILSLKKETKTHQFQYQNIFGTTETFIFVSHFSLADESDMEEIFKKTEIWFKKYMEWEDENIIEDEKAKIN